MIGSEGVGSRSFVSVRLARSVQRKGIVMDEATLLSIQALWYAWGRIDAGEFPGMDSDSAFAFRDWYGSLARAYQAHEVGSRPAIQWEWLRFATAGRVTPVPAAMAVAAVRPAAWLHRAHAPGWGNIG